MLDILFEVCCNNCKKPIKESQFAAHTGLVASFVFIMKVSFPFLYVRLFKFIQLHIDLQMLLSSLLPAFVFCHHFFKGYQCWTLFCHPLPVFSELCRSLKLTDQTTLELDGSAGNRKPPRKEKKKLPAYCPSILKIWISELHCKYIFSYYTILV